MVSFIIPNWNHKQMLSECIASIYATNDSILKDVIVVDNASNDGSGDYIKKMYPEIIWIQNKTNLGYAKAINHGVKVSKGAFIFLLNNDVKLLENTTIKLLDFLFENPEAMAVAPLLYYPDGRIQKSCRRFPTPSALFLEFLGIDKIGPFRRWKLSKEEHLRTSIVLQPMASALMLKKLCWDTVGQLDEQFPVLFNDVDWCYRLYKQTRYKIYLYPEAQAIHHEGASVNRLGFRKKIEFSKGLTKFYLKHFSSLLSEQGRKQPI
jgi:N-acetylglucosaminyl-diphospho-decaprenol L-rhamnosyltransferase